MLYTDMEHDPMFVGIMVDPMTGVDAMALSTAWSEAGAEISASMGWYMLAAICIGLMIVAICAVCFVAAASIFNIHHALLFILIILAMGLTTLMLLGGRTAIGLLCKSRIPIC